MIYSLSNDQYVLFYPDQTFQQMSQQLMRTHQDKLHQSRKLALMVDLDNTLIHTTEMPCQCSPKKVVSVCLSDEGMGPLQRKGRAVASPCFLLS